METFSLHRVAARFGGRLERWLPLATAFALWMAACPAKAGSIELLWQNGQPHPDFSGELHTVETIVGILEDGTVIYRGTLTPDPPTPTSYHSGYYYVRQGERPKPLGGLSYFEKIEQVLLGEGNQLAVVYWPREYPNSVPGEIHIGTPEAFGPTVYQGGPVSSSSSLPQLLQLYGPNRLAFANGVRIYRNLGGANQQINGPDVTLPDVPATTELEYYYLSHMAADGRAVVWATLNRAGYQVGSISWWVDNDNPATYHTIHVDDGGYLGSPTKIYAPDPGRAGWGLYVSPTAANRAGSYGGPGSRINLSGSGNERWIGGQTIGGSPQVLVDPQTIGAPDFTWLINGLWVGPIYNVQMDAQGGLFSRGIGQFSLAPTQRAVMGCLNGSQWQRLVTEGDNLPGLPANVLVGPKQNFALENGGWFIFRSNLTGPGVGSTNNTAWWLGRKTGGSVAFDLLVRSGQTMSFTGGQTGILSLSPPTGDDDYPTTPGPDAGRRRTMNSAGWMAQRFFTTGATNRTGLFLFRPDSQPVVRVETIKASGGSVVLNFSGAAGTQYDLQRAPAATGPWTNLVTLTAPAGGQFGYTNNLPPQPKAFYRLQLH